MARDVRGVQAAVFNADAVAATLGRGQADFLQTRAEESPRDAAP